MLTFIVNPTSSSGNGDQIWQKIEQILQRENAEYEAIHLTGPGEGTVITASLTADGREHTLVVVGGDGTINECIAGISHFDKCTFACIPTGSGNDFARGMNLLYDPEAAVHAILSPKKIKPIHIGVVTDSEKQHRFAVSSGIGFDAAICFEVSRSRLKNTLNRIHFGSLVYTLTALRMLIKMKPLDMRIVTDGKQLLSYPRTFFAAAMNTRYEGGGYMFCPDADPTSDQLDIMIAEGIPKPLVLMIMPIAMKGKHTRMKGIHIIRCRKAVITADRKAHVHTDGEQAGFHQKITWNKTKETLRVIVG